MLLYTNSAAPFINRHEQYLQYSGLHDFFSCEFNPLGAGLHRIPTKCPPAKTGKNNAYNMITGIGDHRCSDSQYIQYRQGVDVVLGTLTTALDMYCSIIFCSETVSAAQRVSSGTVTSSRLALSVDNGV